MIHKHTVMQRIFGWALLVGLALGGAGLLWWQHAAMEPSRAEIAALRGRKEETARLRREQERLSALQVSAEELARLRAERAAGDRLRNEVTALRAKLAERAKSETREKPPLAETGRLIEGRGLPASEWRNVGAATPGAALETALWAAAGGDVEAFAQRIFIDGKARDSARRLWEGLPPAMRAELGSPERVIAFLSIKDVPTGEAKVREWMPSSGVLQPVEVALTSADGAGKEVRLLLIKPPDSAEWKLTVTPAAIAKYTAMLKAAPVAGGK